MYRAYLSAILKSLKLTATFCITLACILFIGVQFSNAVNSPDNPVNIDTYTGSVAQKSGYSTVGVDETTVSVVIGRIIRVALSFIGIIFLCLTIYAGFLWMTAGGSAEQVEKAQEIVKMAVMGLIIVIGCYGLTVFIIAAVTAVSTTQNSGVGKVF